MVNSIRSRLTRARTTLACTVFVIGFALPSHANTDLEYWGHYNLDIKLTDRTAFRLSPQLRLRDDAGDLYHWESAQGFHHKLNSFASVGLYHLFVRIENTRGDWQSENRLRGDLSLATTVLGIKITDRSRYEYRFVGNDDRRRYRNRLQFARAVTIGDQTITPFISGELFYDLDKHENDQNRLVVGVSRKITDTIKASLYYLHVSKKGRRNDWDGTDVIGTMVNFSY